MSKADANYPVVSAAGIAAKVTRDRKIKEWEETVSTGIEDEDAGSGYPSDPRTKDWLKRDRKSVV